MADTESLAGDQSNETKKGQSVWLRRPFIMLSVVLVVILIAGFGYAHWHKSVPIKKQIETAENSNKYPTAISLIKNEISKAATKEQEATLYVQLGNNYANNGDRNQAAQAYLQSADINGMTANLAYLLATTYQASHNNKQAIVYYQKAIQLWPTSDPTRGAEVAYLQQMIQRLQAGGVQ